MAGGLRDKPVPGLTGAINDVLVIVEDSVRKEVGPQVLPDLLDGIEFR